MDWVASGGCPLLRPCAIYAGAGLSPACVLPIDNANA